jgi:multimeric flavodoxin WrbA
MQVLCISGSPRKDGNTEWLLKTFLSEMDGRLIRLTDYSIAHCDACWGCLKRGRCRIQDDMTTSVIPLLLDCDAVVLGSPIFFNNVSADMKAFMDRTWCIRGQLRNKIGGAIVVGRRYGAEAAVSAINSFFLKHDMIVADRGVTGLAFEKGDIAHDAEATCSILRLAERIKEMLSVLDQRTEGQALV